MQKLSVAAVITLLGELGKSNKGILDKLEPWHYGGSDTPLKKDGKDLNLKYTSDTDKAQFDKLHKQLKQMVDLQEALNRLNVETEFEWDGCTTLGGALTLVKNKRKLLSLYRGLASSYKVKVEDGSVIEYGSVLIDDVKDKVDDLEDEVRRLSAKIDEVNNQTFVSIKLDI